MYSRVYRTKFKRTPVKRLFSPIRKSTTRNHGAHGFIKFILSESLAVSVVRFAGLVVPVGGKKMDSVLLSKPEGKKTTWKTWTEMGKLWLGAT